MAQVLGGIPETRPSAHTTLVYDHVLPNVPGKSIRVVVVEYAPGANFDIHAHSNSAFVYATVLDGSIQNQINDGPITLHREGDGFSGRPGDHYGINENASVTWPARLLVVFVADTSEKIVTHEERLQT